MNEKAAFLLLLFHLENSDVALSLPFPVPAEQQLTQALLQVPATNNRSSSPLKALCADES